MIQIIKTVQAGYLLALLAFPAMGQEAVQSYQLDAPFAPPATLPAWLHLPPAAATNFAQLTFQITPTSDIADESLLLTVIFEDQSSGFLRVYTQSGETSQTLSDNLMEGITGTNQRTLLVPNAQTPSPTLVTLQTGSANLPIRRLIWNWVKPQTVLVAPNNLGAVALRGGVVLRDTDISGAPLPTPTTQTSTGYVSVPLQDSPEEINGGISFVLVMDQLPVHARIEGKVLSSSVKNRLLCRVNGHLVPEFTPPPPSLTDEHYLIAPTDLTYAGWLTTSLYLPTSLWNHGENLVELIPITYDGQASTPQISLKDTLLELLFPPSQS